MLTPYGSKMFKIFLFILINIFQKSKWRDHQYHLLNFLLSFISDKLMAVLTITGFGDKDESLT